MQYILQTPLSKADLAPLRAGDTVLLSGVVYTARDAAHARMMELLDQARSCRSPSRRSNLLCRPHAGAPGLCHWCRRTNDFGPDGCLHPAAARSGPCLYDRQRQAQRGRQAVSRAERRRLSGGHRRGRCLMANSVQSCEVIAWPDLGCEAVRRLVVRDFPLTVLLDAHGGDLYQSGPAAYLAARENRT